jgi:transposase, IS30 family
MLTPSELAQRLGMHLSTIRHWHHAGLLQSHKANDEHDVAHRCTGLVGCQIRFVAPALLLDHRPAAVEQRVRVGDWEGDLLVGRMSQSAIGTLVDRTSRYLKLVHLPVGHSAEQLLLALTQVMASVPQQARLTLTWDQGSEMAYHDRIAVQFAEGVYFAHPASPWQRGTNENTNGLLRQYFPKRTDLNVHTQADLHEAEERLNHRPRRILGCQTPAQIFHSAMAE